MKIWWIAALLASTGCSDFNKPSSSKLDESKNKRVQERIEQLDSEINRYEKKAMGDELDGQDSFRDDYSKFAKEMEASEQNEEKVRELEKEKQALQDMLLSEKK